jgi:hypothetical protein
MALIAVSEFTRKRQWPVAGGQRGKETPSPWSYVESTRCGGCTVEDFDPVGEALKKK